MHPRAHPPRNTSHDIIEEENDAYFSFPRVILGPMTRCELRKAAKEEERKSPTTTAAGGGRDGAVSLGDLAFITLKQICRQEWVRDICLQVHI